MAENFEIYSDNDCSFEYDKLEEEDLFCDF